MSTMSPSQISANLVAPRARIAHWAPVNAGTTIATTAALATEALRETARLTALTRQLRVWEEIVVADLSGLTTPAGLTMPDVAEAAGHTYFIYVNTSVGGNGTIVVTANDDPLVFDVSNAAAELFSAFGDTGQDLTANGDYIRMQSDGVFWHVLSNKTT